MSATSIPLTPQQRKSTGAYYTPKPLIDLLLNHALPTSDPEPQTPGFKILDPACGPGDFLLTAAQRLPQAHLLGIDINPTALAQCRAAFTQDSALSTQDLTLLHTDALLHPPPQLQPQSFDLILGNPPFVNAIEHDLTPHTKLQLRQRHPTIQGAADLACYFLDQAAHLVRPGGRIAFVLPRALLNSPATAYLRANLPPHLQPNLIYAPERHDFFQHANIFITLLIVGPNQTCKVSTDPNPETAHFIEGPITNTNWWLAAQDILSPAPVHFDVRCSMFDVRCSDFPPPSSLLHPPPSPSLLKHHFDLHASMTAADAYNLLPHLTDSPTTPGQKLITTGLINPNTPLWGTTTCRYLKRDFQHPVIPDTAPLPKSLAKRIVKSKRPKILLAGLSKKLESFLDETGQYTGAVATFSIYHPTDDLPALRALNTHLLHPATTQTIKHYLGANALRGQHITLKKPFLQNLPLPKDFDCAHDRQHAGVKRRELHDQSAAPDPLL